MKALIFICLFITLLNASESFLPDSNDLSLPTKDMMLLGASMPCNICAKVMSFAVGKIEKLGCGFLFKLEVVAMCELAGLGPEDPLSEVCAAGLIASCSEIAQLITSHVTDPTQLCYRVHLCA